MLPYKRISKGALGLIVAGAISIGGMGIGYANLASAQSTTGGSSQTEIRNKRPQMRPGTVMGKPGRKGPKGGKGVMGTVSAVNGNTVTITNPNGTTYTVDATNAKISKISTISVSGIAVGDKIGVQGSLNGTSVTALSIMDGVK